MDEALHEKKIAGIADKIAKNKDLKVVLIAGPSSSGKTTFAKRLEIELRLNGLKPKTISVDNYFVERCDTPRDENGEYDFENIKAIDTDLLNKDLLKLLNGEEIEAPVCLAGSINSYKRLDEIKELSPWSFTIGSAFFEKRFGETIAEQIDRVCSYIQQP